MQQMCSQHLLAAASLNKNRGTRNLVHVQTEEGGFTNQTTRQHSGIISPQTQSNAAIIKSGPLANGVMTQLSHLQLPRDGLSVRDLSNNKRRLAGKHSSMLSPPSSASAFNSRGSTMLKNRNKSVLSRKFDGRFLVQNSQKLPSKQSEATSIAQGIRDREKIMQDEYTSCL